MRLALLFALVSYCYCLPESYTTESPDIESTPPNDADFVQGLKRRREEICYLAKLAVQAKKEDIRHYKRERSFSRRKAQILCGRISRKCHDKIVVLRSTDREGEVLTPESDAACHKESNACFAKFGHAGAVNDHHQAAIKGLELQLLDRLIGQKRVCYGGYGGGGGEPGR